MFKYRVDRDAPDHEWFEIVINGVVVDLFFITRYEKEIENSGSYWINNLSDKGNWKHGE